MGDDVTMMAVPRPFLDRMVTMLRELEWAGHDCMSLCPVCGERPERTQYVRGKPVDGRPGFVCLANKLVVGHNPGCELNQLLTEVGRE